MIVKKICSAVNAAIKKQMGREGGEDERCPQRECDGLSWELLWGNHTEKINLQHGEQDC